MSRTKYVYNLIVGWDQNHLYQKKKHEQNKSLLGLHHNTIYLQIINRKLNGIVIILRAYTLFFLLGDKILSIVTTGASNMTDTINARM